MSSMDKKGEGGGAMLAKPSSPDLHSEPALARCNMAPSNVSTCKKTRSSIAVSGVGQHQVVQVEFCRPSHMQTRLWAQIADMQNTVSLSLNCHWQFSGHLYKYNCGTFQKNRRKGGPCIKQSASLLSDSRVSNNSSYLPCCCSPLAASSFGSCQKM